MQGNSANGCLGVRLASSFLANASNCPVSEDNSSRAIAARSSSVLVSSSICVSSLTLDCDFSHAFRASATRESSPTRLAVWESKEEFRFFWRVSCSVVRDWARWRRAGASRASTPRLLARWD